MFKKRGLMFSLVALLLVGTLALVGCGNGTAKEEAKYPTKPIEVYVGYAAGGATDISIRMIAPYLEEQLGQSVVVVNKPGGGAEIAFTATAKAKPDGYSLGIINTPTVIAIPLSRTTNYKVDDFEVIGNIAFDENVIVAKADGKFKTLEDLIEKAKANPGTITLGHSGLYADDHLASLAFQQAAGIQLKDTAFQGTAPSLVSLLGGHIDVVVGNVADVVEQVKEGKLIVLATMGEKEHESLPGSVTLKSKDFDIVMGSYRALAAPKGTPQEVLEKLRDALKIAAEDPDYLQKAKDTKQPIYYLDADSFSKVLKNDQNRLENLWKDLNLPTQQ